MEFETKFEGDMVRLFPLLWMFDDGVYIGKW